MKKFVDAAVQKISKATEGILGEEQIRTMLKEPPLEEMGDIGLPCFALCKIWRMPPETAARRLAENINTQKDELLSKVEANGGYVNFFFNQVILASNTLKTVLEQGNSYGSSNIGEGKKVVIDFSSPNIGKPMHVGHIRSTILGDSLERILSFCGFRCYGINYLGDTGLHIGKILVALEEWGDEKRIAVDPEKELLTLYVRFSEKEKEAEEAREETETTNLTIEASPEEEEKGLESVNPWTVRAKEALQRLEAGDPDALALWQKVKGWSLKAFQRVYDLLDIEFDEITGQSYFSEAGKHLVYEALGKGIAVEEKGAVFFPLDKEGLPPKVVLRADGTALYVTQDIGAAAHRYEKHRFDRMLYVVASEQSLYFAQLFAILKRIGFEWAERCIHIPFGLIHLEGGRLSTRAGRVIFLEDVLKRAIELASQNILQRNPDLPNREEVARAVGIGAVKFAVLSVDRERDIWFSWDRVLNFDGKAAPYILYTYARANSILRKAKSKPGDFSAEHFDHPTERRLIKRIAYFPSVVERALQTYQPSVIADYAFQLSKAFTDFYEQVRVIDGSEKEGSRLTLIEAFRVTLRNALSLLGIQTVEKM